MPKWPRTGYFFLTIPTAFCLSYHYSFISSNITNRSDFYPGLVTANGKKVVAADVKADNGLIHVIEDALYPLPQPSFIEILSNDPKFVAKSGVN